MEPTLSVAQTRCLNHAEREAAVRCPGCGHFFCRECVTEHKRRFLCARCIAAETEARSGAPSGRIAALRPLMRLVLGLLALWLVFCVVGWALLSIPSTFHDATGHRPSATGHRPSAVDSAISLRESP